MPESPHREDDAMSMVERSFFTVTNAAGETISVPAIRQGQCIGFDLPSGVSERFTVKDLLNAALGKGGE
jgi:hypothetical protein